MFAIIGIVVVFGAVVGGYLMEHGNIKVLVQPAELLIIAGAGVGTLLIANPLHILKSIASGLPGVIQRVQIHQGLVPRFAEDDVRTLWPRAPGWTGGAGERHG